MACEVVFDADFEYKTKVDRLLEKVRKQEIGSGEVPTKRDDLVSTLNQLCEELKNPSEDWTESQTKNQQTGSVVRTLRIERYPAAVLYRIDYPNEKVLVVDFVECEGWTVKNMKLKDN